MIDLHCHYLPAVDDGCQSLDEALAALRIAKQQGITRAVITPHIHCGVWNNTASSLRQLWPEFSAAITAEEIGIELALAAEVRLEPELMRLLERGELPFVGYLSGRHVLLLELPYSHIPPGTEQLLRWLERNKVTPLIAHPERNRAVIAEPECIKPLIENGALLQLTVSAFVGEFGEAVQRTAAHLVGAGWGDVVASDAHRPLRRPPKVQAGLAALAELVGEARMRMMSQTLPQQISASLFDDDTICSAVMQTDVGVNG